MTNLRVHKIAIVLLIVAAGLGLSQMAVSRFTQDAEMTMSEPGHALKNPRIVIRKKESRLELFDGAHLVKTYPVVFGFAPTGDKEKEGDGRTPEGEFYVFVKNPKSKFHLSLGISYPSKEDAVRGLAAGLISRAQHDAIVKAIDETRMPPQKTPLGGEIYIHGGGVGGNWTWGCIAMNNEDVEELYNLVNVGAKVTIYP